MLQLFFIKSVVDAANMEFQKVWCRNTNLTDTYKTIFGLQANYQVARKVSYKLRQLFKRKKRGSQSIQIWSHQTENFRQTSEDS